MAWPTSASSLRVKVKGANVRETAALSQHAPKLGLSKFRVFVVYFGLNRTVLRPEGTCSGFFAEEEESGTWVSMMRCAGL